MRRQAIIVLGFISLIAVTTAASGTSPGKTSPPAGKGELSAHEILTRTAENYRGDTEYAFTGEVATRMTLNGEVQSVLTRLAGAYGGPGHSLLTAGSEGDSSFFLTAGDTTWSYSARLGQYAAKVTDRAAMPHGLPGLDPLGPHPFAGYARLDRDVQSVQLAGRDTVTVGNRVLSAYVLEVSYDKTVTARTDSGATFSAKRLVIDPERFLVLRDRITVERMHPMLAKPLKIEQVATYDRVQWNAPQPASAFVFHAPPGAVFVEKLGAVAEPEPEDSPLVGKAALDFTLADLAGKSKRLSGFKGKVVLIDFWATWCGPCRMEMPEIEKLHARYRADGLVVLGINCSESPTRAGAFVDKYDYTFPILLDRDGAVARLYGIDGIPTVVVIDRKGNVAAHLVGARSGDQLVAALQKAGLTTGP
jgi:thiol-disulfide isomerase/thioredoxin